MVSMNKQTINFKNPILKELNRLSTKDVWERVVGKPLSKQQITFAEKKIKEQYPLFDLPIFTIFPIFKCCERKLKESERQKLLKKQYKLPKETRRLIQAEDEALERACQLGGFNYEGTPVLSDA